MKDQAWGEKKNGEATHPILWGVEQSIPSASNDDSDPLSTGFPLFSQIRKENGVRENLLGFRLIG